MSLNTQRIPNKSQKIQTELKSEGLVPLFSTRILHVSMFLGTNAGRLMVFAAGRLAGGEEGKKLASDELEPVGTAGEGCLNG